MDPGLLHIIALHPRRFRSNLWRALNVCTRSQVVANLPTTATAYQEALLYNPDTPRIVVMVLHRDMTSCQGGRRHCQAKRSVNPGSGRAMSSPGRTGHS